MARHRSSATWLALVYAVLVVYASLYPFTGWRWPPGQSLFALMQLPSALHQSSFDIWSNLLGYLPLGVLLALAALRSGWRARTALLMTMVLILLLSFTSETLQHFVPRRVPAREDLAFNLLGGIAGCLLALTAQATGAVDRWNRVRSRWFAGDAAFALALLALWPVGLLFPNPVVLGLGRIGGRLRDWSLQALEGADWAEPLTALLSAPSPVTLPLQPLPEMLIVTLGLLAPCLVAYSVVAPGWRRVVMALGALALAAGSMTLSTLLNFGPHNALSWLGPRSVPGLLLGCAAALMLAPLSCKRAAGVGLVVLTGLIAGVAQAPDDPYFAQSLQDWEQGRFVRFHGLAQWIGWIWPFAAMGWMFSRLGAKG